MGFAVNALEKRKAKLVASAGPYLPPDEIVGVCVIVQTYKQQAQAMMGATPWVQMLLMATDRNVHLFALSPLKNEVTAHLDTIPIATAGVAMDHGSVKVGPAYLAPIGPAEKRVPEFVAWVQQRQAPAAAPPPPAPAAQPQAVAPPPPAPPPAPGWQPLP